MPNRDPQTEMKYFTSGFIDIQEQLIQSFIYITSIKFNITNIYNQLMNNIGIEMKMFPTTTYHFDPLLINIIFLLPQLMILNWILSIILTVKYMIDEKENRLIDYLRIFNIKIYMNCIVLLRYNELPNDISLIPFCFIPQVSYSLCWIFINRLESKGTGAQWSNLWETNNSNSILSLGSSMIFYGLE
ncbi:unnamed protein product [Schistosoma mattheei]|uniref:Uncharacterized protein n=1 Tax=Schistosoma mattheei TaxID=31246 RepID=A0AA85B1W7_9TREM|nr:unnamed protein product [Schistosoma mattheei]